MIIEAKLKFRGKRHELGLTEFYPLPPHSITLEEATKTLTKEIKHELAQQRLSFIDLKFSLLSLEEYLARNI